MGAAEEEPWLLVNNSFRDVSLLLIDLFTNILLDYDCGGG